MRQVTESQFNSIINDDTRRENEERASVGLAPLEVSVRRYAGVTGSAEGMVEYSFGGSMFAFSQGGAYFSNGL